MLGRNQRI